MEHNFKVSHCTITFHENGIPTGRTNFGRIFPNYKESFYREGRSFYVNSEVHLYRYQLVVRDIINSDIAVVGFWKEENSECAGMPQYVAFGPEINRGNQMLLRSLVDVLIDDIDEIEDSNFGFVAKLMNSID